MKYLFTIIFFAFNLFSYEEVIKKEFPLKGIESIWVENVNGDIEIYGDEGEKILIEAIKKAEKMSYLKNLNVKMEVLQGTQDKDFDYKTNGKVLHIETEHTRSYLLGFLPVKMGGSVKYKINLPKNLNLKIETVNGSIIIERVEGLIKCESVNGSLNLKGISGKGYFETVNGDINMEITEGYPNFSAESVNGDIDITSIKEINANYSIEVVNGKIKIIPEILEIKSSSPKEISGKWGEGKGRIDIETVNGSVTIETKLGKSI